MPFEITVFESDINTVLRTKAPGLAESYVPRNLPLENAVVDLHTDSVAVSGLTEFRGRLICVTITGVPKLRNSRSVEFDVRSVKIGKWNPPGFVERAIISQIRRDTSGMTATSHVPLKGIVVEPGKLRIRG